MMKKIMFAILIVVAVTTENYGQASFYNVYAGDGNGVRFWQDDAYKIHMGNSSEYHFGPVTDYSIKTNMNPTAGRGWTWGIHGNTPIAALSNGGHMQIAGTFNSQGVRIPGRYSFGQSESAFEMEVPTSEYNAIRAYNGNQHIGTIHFFDDTWQGGGNSSGAINIDGETGVTIGNWFNSIAHFGKASGNVGIGTNAPTQRLDVRGNLVLDNGANPVLHTGTGTTELNRYLLLANSSGFGSASGLKAGGILVSDSYAYASPGKNDLVVKGNVGIGTPTPGSFKLAVNGKIWGTAVQVALTNPAPDYVFEKSYALPSLEEVKSYIDQNKHLPEVPSAKEMEANGVNIGEMNMLLLKKIEELTLYVIELKNENADHQKKNMSMQKQIDDLIKNLNKKIE